MAPNSSLRRTKKYNRKARHNLIRNGAKTAVLQSEDLEKDLQRIMNNLKIKYQLSCQLMIVLQLISNQIKQQYH